MLPASNKGAGMNFGAPDVCVTPPGVPIPYPNFAMNAQAAEFAVTVKICMMNALNMGSEIPITSGDEPGVLSPNKQAGRYTMGNPTVNVEGLPAISLLCPTTGNNANDGVGAVVVPSVANVFYSCAPPVPEGAALAWIRGLAGALDPAGSTSTSGPDEGGVVHLSLRCFPADVPARVFSALRRFSTAPSLLVIDLRDNPGGELHAAIDLAGDFLPPGTPIVSVADADGDAIVYRARQERPYSFPVALLVDRRTASAAEVFAGCLQAHGRALVIGETTYGKGTGHEVRPHPGGSGAVYAPVVRCLLPGGRPIDGIGVQPDVLLTPKAP